jgi:hypothetical protein
MSRIDRRAFVLGCVATPLAGCTGQSLTASTVSTTLLPARFLNDGFLRPTGDTPVFVVTGGIKP